MTDTADSTDSYKVAVNTDVLSSREETTGESMKAQPAEASNNGSTQDNDAAKVLVTTMTSTSPDEIIPLAEPLQSTTTPHGRGIEPNNPCLSLTCHEEMPPFYDKTMFNRLFVPNMSRPLQQIIEDEPIIQVKRTLTDSMEETTKSSSLGATKDNGKKKKKHKTERFSTKEFKRKAAKLLDEDERREVRRRLKKTIRNGVESSQDAILHPLMYDWSELGLGETTGTAAWNMALRNQVTGATPSGSIERTEAPQLTPEECYDIINSRVSLRTLLPPNETSSLYEGVQHHSCHVGNGSVLSPEAKGKPNGRKNGDESDIEWMLSNLYRDMIAQETDLAERVDYYKYSCSAPDIRQSLVDLEERAALLDRRESRIEQTAKHLGLWNDEDEVRVQEQRGFIPSQGK